VYDLLMDSFDCLPLAALVNKKFLCIHGGLSPDVETVNDIKDVFRFQEPPTSGVLCDLLWSDPLQEYDTADEPDFVDNAVRGCSYSYSFDVVKSFLDRNNLFSLIRAHEPHNEGYCLYKKHPQTGFPTVITIFSAPNYCDSHGNKAAIIECDNKNVMNIRQFKAVPHPYYLPNFMNVFTWSLPFVAEKVTELFLAILKMVEGEDEEDDEEQLALKKKERNERIKAKVLAMSKCLGMLSTLRQQNEMIMTLKGLVPNNQLPPGMLSSGPQALKDMVQSFDSAKKVDAFYEKRPPPTQEMKVEQAKAKAEEAAAPSAPTNTEEVIPYEKLKTRAIGPTVQIDKLEAYLSDEEFVKVFGLNKTDFYKLPKWKQRDKKKAANLF
jgi:serine/threonine-protein phosphatase 2B catalytic subunit